MRKPAARFAAIALGGNLGDAPATLLQGIETLAEQPCIRITAISPLYRSVAVGPGKQADYANAVILITTTLPALELLDLLQIVEAAAGRVRQLHWGARTLDLDILLYAEDVIQTPRLTVPHTHMLQRNFVLRPLADVAPKGLKIADELVSVLADHLGMTDLVPWPDPRWRTLRTTAT